MYDFNIYAIKKNDKLSNEAYFYLNDLSELKIEVSIFEDCGGYPPIDILERTLNLDFYLKDTDDVYFSYYDQYLKKITEYKKVLSEIEESKILDEKDSVVLLENADKETFSTFKKLLFVQEDNFSQIIDHQLLSEILFICFSKRMLSHYHFLIRRINDLKYDYHFILKST